MSGGIFSVFFSAKKKAKREILSQTKGGDPGEVDDPEWFLGPCLTFPFSKVQLTHPVRDKPSDASFRTSRLTVGDPRCTHT